MVCRTFANFFFESDDHFPKKFCSSQRLRAQRDYRPFCEGASRGITVVSLIMGSVVFFLCFCQIVSDITSFMSYFRPKACIG